MQTFKMTDDNNRLYFKNLNRIAPKTELKNIIELLKENNVSISLKKEAGLDDIYSCNLDDMSFDIIYTGEETFLYSDDEGCIERLEQMLNVW